MADTWWPIRRRELATARRCTEAPFTLPSGIPGSEHSSAMRTGGLLESRGGVNEAAGLGEQPGQRVGCAALIEHRFRAPAGGGAPPGRGGGGGGAGGREGGGGVRA